MIGTIKDAVTSGGYTAVRLPANQGCSSYTIWTADGTAFEVATVSAGTDAVLVAEPTDVTKGFPLVVNQPYGADPAGKIVCYAKGTASTDVVGIITQ